MTQDSNDYNTHTHVVLARGTMVQHYSIVRKIGAGGMGEVNLAEETKLDRRVALKFLPVQHLGNQELQVRFVSEAKAAAKLNHSNIVMVFEVSKFQDRPFIAMEHVEGESLHHFAHDEPLPVDRIVELGIQICEGLSEAHGAKVVHRDI